MRGDIFLVSSRGERYFRNSSPGYRQTGELPSGRMGSKDDIFRKEVVRVKDLEKYIRQEIEGFVSHDVSNRLGGSFGEEPIWRKPLVGFCRGDDSLFDIFKTEAVGPEHWSPLEAYREAFPEDVCGAGELSVVSWVLPHTEKTLEDNRREKEKVSLRWARSRIMGERVNDALRAFLPERLAEQGLPAVAPVSLPRWTRIASPRFLYASTWSERHVAHACGLGTFGLCDGLITSVGKAVRFGSVVIRAELTPTPRPYSRYDAYCPFLVDGSCGACMARCPVGAITPRGHDKAKCRAFSGSRMTEYLKEAFDFEGYGCGLCQTGVPCEKGIPFKGSR